MAGRNGLPLAGGPYPAMSAQNGQAEFEWPGGGWRKSSKSREQRAESKRRAFPAPTRKPRSESPSGRTYSSQRGGRAEEIGNPSGTPRLLKTLPSLCLADLTTERDILMNRGLRRVFFVLGSVIGLAAPALGQLSDPIPEPIPDSGIRVRLKEVASGLTAPNLLTHAGDGSGRKFIVDQAGTIRILKRDNTLLATPFLDVSDRLDTLPGRNENPPTPGDGLDPIFDERGLLGLAFHPDFDTPGAQGEGKFFTYHSEAVDGPADFTVPNPSPFNHQSVIMEWQVDPSDPNRADPSSAREIMRIDQPQFNHNAGMIEFGPDGLLHIALGDGGAANDVADGHTPDVGNGQDPSNVLGSMLRIDVDGNNSANGQYGIPDDNPFLSDAFIPDETYAFGFRNPFRFSFDADRLIVGDVGQNNIEEINIVEAGGNFGWNLKEGSFAFNPDDGTVSDDLSGLPDDLIDPVLEFDHDEGLAVVGGFVARDAGIPALEGLFVFGDFSQSFFNPSGRLFAGDLDTGEIGEILINATGDELGLFVKGFGRDEDGNLFLLAGPNLGPSGSDGLVFQLTVVPEPSSLALAALGLPIALAVVAQRRRRSRGARIPTAADSPDSLKPTVPHRR